MAHLSWDKGGEADLQSLEGDSIALRSTIPSAPGSRLQGSLVTGARVRMKVHRCRRVEGGFDIEGRLLDATREARAELDALLG